MGYVRTRKQESENLHSGRGIFLQAKLQPISRQVFVIKLDKNQDDVPAPNVKKVATFGNRILFSGDARAHANHEHGHELIHLELPDGLT